MLRNTTKANSTDQQEKVCVFNLSPIAVCLYNIVQEKDAKKPPYCRLRLNMICAVLMLLPSTPSPLTPPLVVCRF